MDGTGSHTAVPFHGIYDVGHRKRRFFYLS